MNYVELQKPESKDVEPEISYLNPLEQAEMNQDVLSSINSVQKSLYRTLPVQGQIPVTEHSPSPDQSNGDES